MLIILLCPIGSVHSAAEWGIELLCIGHVDLYCLRLLVDDRAPDFWQIWCTSSTRSDDFVYVIQRQKTELSCSGVEALNPTLLICVFVQHFDQIADLNIELIVLFRCVSSFNLGDVERFDGFVLF